MCRKRGKVVLVGVVGLALDRTDFYENEISFQVSCSYGPGRYDAVYEKKGLDYPIGYVRWTEQRNFESVLRLMSEGKLQIDALLSARFPLDEAEERYSAALTDPSLLGVMIDYSVAGSERKRRVQFRRGSEHEGGSRWRHRCGKLCLSVLVPALKRNGAQLRAICSRTECAATCLLASMALSTTHRLPPNPGRRCD